MEDIKETTFSRPNSVDTHVNLETVAAYTRPVQRQARKNPSTRREMDTDHTPRLQDIHK